MVVVMGILWMAQVSSWALFWQFSFKETKNK
jgi:hypothetical protein